MIGSGEASLSLARGIEQPDSVGIDRLAVITARGGSKRIPRKNIRLFEGKPILGRVIETALESGLFDEVMVSTDDDEIAETARTYGAMVPFPRSAKTSDDHATTTDVLREVLEAYVERGRLFTHVCCLYPTAAFVTPALLENGWRTLREERFDTVFPVVRFPAPVQRALRRHEDGRVERILIEYESARSQDLDAAFYDAGQFYWFVVESFLRSAVLLGARAGGVVVDESTVHDIDDEADWQTAERKFRLLNGSG